MQAEIFDLSDLKVSEYLEKFHSEHRKEEIMATVMTMHAQERLKERHGVKSKKKAQHLCDNAFERGIRSDRAKGSLKKWLEQKTRPGSYAACYQNLAFIFSEKDSKCITVLNLPPTVTKDFNKLILPS